MTKVMIVEDDPMARKLIEIFVSDNKNYEIVHSIESAAMAEIYCMTSPVDLILMDVCTAMNANGLDASEKIKKQFPDIKIIIITSQPECSFIDRAHEVGVDSFWYKEPTAENLISTMDRTMEGECIYPTNTPLLKLGDALSVNFTDREIEVLRQLAGGEPDAEIAKNLNITVRTVKSHIQSMREKTGFRNRTELAVRARESGFVINTAKLQEETE
ncbi:MAG: response regulator transcription factor [Ruminococcaceae bacterium]|nr:response regulator transcription factor [Oscillospiraceae bacterium]